VTLDPDVASLVQRAMRERGLSFKEALNDAVRAGLAPTSHAPTQMPTYDLGEPLVPLDKALRLAGELEDDELIRRLEVGK
jgi:hypothetical protein